ncbi:hypothetical protein GF318_03265 [Candidatus Micrarchaeota archaeon]|nr:hypothetical protein [Candidatus Micrarchaeota archaeon]
MCRAVQESGADFAIVHARTTGQGYRDSADWETIRIIRENIDIPVMGNGDIASSRQGENMVKQGYCDGFMIARAAMSNPPVFCNRKADSFGDRISLLEEYVSIHRRYRGEPEQKDVRMKAIHFMAGVKKAASIREKTMKSKSVEGVFDILEKTE